MGELIEIGGDSNRSITVLIKKIAVLIKLSTYSTPTVITEILSKHMGMVSYKDISVLHQNSDIIDAVSKKLFNKDVEISTTHDLPHVTTVKIDDGGMGFSFMLVSNKFITSEYKRRDDYVPIENDSVQSVDVFGLLGARHMGELTISEHTKINAIVAEYKNSDKVREIECSLHDAPAELDVVSEPNTVKSLLFASLIISSISKLQSTGHVATISKSLGAATTPRYVLAYKFKDSPKDEAVIDVQYLAEAIDKYAPSLRGSIDSNHGLLQMYSVTQSEAVKYVSGEISDKQTTVVADLIDTDYTLMCMISAHLHAGDVLPRILKDINSIKGESNAVVELNI